MSAFVEYVLGQSERIALPILTYPGAALIGATVRDMVTRPQIQAAAQAALHRQHPSPFALTAMDLSVEAEAFGSEVLLTDHEIPTVIGRLVTNREGADALAVPEPGGRRTGVYLETVGLLKKLPEKRFVFAGMVGPFSLAARLFGVSEALSLTVDDPPFMHGLVRKSAQFLARYAQAFRHAGADGVIVAEPTAGLLSPRALAEFSSAYVREIVAAVDDGHFTVALHNCAAKLVHLPSVLGAGAKVLHFGAPMDLPAALKQVPPGVVLCGNLDPARVFVNSTPAEVGLATRQLLQAAQAHRHFVLSSGCDVPPGSPPANIGAFYEALR